MTGKDGGSEIGTTVIRDDVSMNTIEAQIQILLGERLSCFKIFADVAKKRGKEEGQLAQFKTEKWLQAELLLGLWRRGYSVIPEYGADRWDLAVQTRGGKVVKIALKCLSDSAQSAKRDFQGIRTDVIKVLDSCSSANEAFLVLILPLGRRITYTSDILRETVALVVGSECLVDVQDSLFTDESGSGIKRVLVRQG